MHVYTNICVYIQIYVYAPLKDKNVTFPPKNPAYLRHTEASFDTCKLFRKQIHLL